MKSQLRASTGSLAHQTNDHHRVPLGRSTSSTLTASSPLTEELEESSTKPSTHHDTTSDSSSSVYVTKTRSLVSQWLHGKTVHHRRPQELIVRHANVIKEGHLLKQGTRLKMWTRRYFILHLEDHHMTLGYYTGKDDLTLCSETPIGPGHRLFDKSSAKHPFRLELRSGTRALVFEAEGLEAFTSWKVALEEAIRWHDTMVNIGEGGHVVKYGSQALEHMVEAKQQKQADLTTAARESSSSSSAEAKSKAGLVNKSSSLDKSRPKFLPASREGNQCFMASNARFDISLKFKYQKVIGSGAYGVVISARDTEVGKDVAIKNIQKAFDDLTDAKRILRELKIMKHLGDHKHILGVTDILPPVSLASFEDVYIVSDAMATDLHRVIYSRHALSNEHVAYFMYQLICALKYMHSANVIHRDLKPSNVLVNGNCELRICDFGLARGLAPPEEDVETELTEYVVTRWYRAPEIMLGCMNYSGDVDVWALGCIFAEMISRKPLFPGQDYIDQLHLIMNTLGAPKHEDLGFLSNPRARKFMESEHAKRGSDVPKPLASHFKTSLNRDALDLMTRMLVMNPADRISVDEALAHPYFRSIRVPEDEILAPSVFDFEFEKHALAKQDIQRHIWNEMVHFHPEYRTGEGNEKASTCLDSSLIPLAALIVEDNQLEHEKEPAAAAAAAVEKSTNTKEREPALAEPQEEEEEVVQKNQERGGQVEYKV